ncbi:DUF397 domain-containing protein [Planomonospora sp. ID67723]|uniref:DUF397 domain-containing protein n=1 Tax=Planomonospora sp. ID67723 TaxID=2738134 RepID=UPI0018C40F1B|nr:DUF397 domain-containing protein [Planomonospora sp. ID67723]MBG0828531.1 DUF397 domain-containing protein [Planomonospora sp. ID67723]
MTTHCPDDVSWVKSSLSSTNNECVEVARPDRGPVLVRDSKDPDGPKLAFTQAEWRAFVAGVKGGELDV